MRYLSTRGEGKGCTISTAMLEGLAGDGGLYVPESCPLLSMDRFEEGLAITDFAVRVLEPFFVGDPLSEKLAEICKSAFNFPLPLVELGEGAVLELFHGPSAAFKDVGARFLAACFSHLDDNERTILVATSGDTGAAVAAAFHRKAGIQVGILFPVSGVAERQRQQLCCWDDNVRAFAVDGSFDDCQAILKQAFAKEVWRMERRLTTANSINIGRLLPQVVYYAMASIEFERKRGKRARFIIPSGNAGNATAALWATAMGFPLAAVHMVSNANRTIPDYIRSGEWRPRASVCTHANAMDVGNPGNMERIFSLYPDVEVLRKVVSSSSVSDEEIEARIAEGPTRYGRVFDPHTATAVQAWQERNEGADVLVATAHAAKFPELVERLTGDAVPVPPALAEMLSRKTRCVTIAARLSALEEVF